MTTYTIETRLADGTLVEVIAAGLEQVDVAPVIAECLAEREADTLGAIVGILTIRPVLDIWVIAPDGRKGEVIAIDSDPANKPMIVRHLDDTIGYYHRDQVEPA